MLEEKSDHLLLQLAKMINEKAMDQAIQLDEPCEHPEMGNFVQTLGYDFLIETLELNQPTFDAEYPELASLSTETRLSMRDAFVMHVAECRRCQVHVKDERIWSNNFANFLKTEITVVKRIVGEKRTAPRDKPRALTAKSR